jgi:biotin carboxyl carrier protein
VIAVVDGQLFEVWPEPAPAVPPIQPRQSRPAAGPRPGPNGRTPLDADPKAVVAPIPGVILEISVRQGDEVEVGQQLYILEAMKMKQSIKASRAGTIATIHAAPGQHVKHHELLIEFVD